MIDFLEEDLYEPIKKYFVENGFEVKAEVKSCDIVAKKDDLFYIIEMKKNFSLKLIYQALDREKYCNCVFLAIPKPKTKAIKNILKLLKKLGLGLIVVSLETELKFIEILLLPNINRKNKNKRVIKEFNNRIIENNKGGISKRKIITAYREKSLKIAFLLNKIGPSYTRDLIKNYGLDKNTNAILNKNFYNWFIKIERGLYDISVIGKEEIENDLYSKHIEYFNSTAI